MTPLTPPSAWQRFLETPEADARLAAVYGNSPALHEARRAACLTVLQRFQEAFGDAPVALYRAPARISLNPHSDHQGAWVPYGTHARELLCACAPAEPGRFDVVNVDPQFASPLAFDVTEEIARAPVAWEESWRAYIEDPAIVASRLALVDPPGATVGRRSTAMYVRAAALRLNRGRPEMLPGLRMALHGDIPQGGGLSSSSAVVVATACALNDFGGLEIPRRQLAEVCGEAEWFVGTRGGSGDHAAMLLGHRAGLAHLRFDPPFGIRGILHSAFPAAYQLILANCCRKAEKSASERLFFNRGVFAYRFAYLALRDALRRMAGAPGVDAEAVDGATCLGEIHVERFPLAVIYRLLLELPERISPAELRDRYPESFAAAARGCFGTTDPAALPPDIPLRGAALYGLGRVDRGLVMPTLLARAGAMAEFGQLMSVTHDGDRVTTWRDGRCEPYTGSQDGLGDGRLEEWMTVAREGSGRPRWAEAQLRRQPGFYGASIPELDRIVDLARSLPEVRGAGLMGAGGGGYVLILADAGEPVFEMIRACLEREYYRPQDLRPAVERWQPVDAAGPIGL